MQPPLQPPAMPSPDLPPLPPFDQSHRGLYSTGNASNNNSNPYDDSLRRPSQHSHELTSPAGRSEYSSPRPYSTPSTSASPQQQAFPSPNQYYSSTSNGAVASLVASPALSSYTAGGRSIVNPTSMTSPEELEALTSPIANQYRSRQPSLEGNNAQYGNASVDPSHSRQSHSSQSYTYDASPGAQSSSSSSNQSHHQQYQPTAHQQPHSQAQQLYSTSPGSGNIDPHQHFQQQSHQHPSRTSYEEMARRPSASSSSGHGHSMTGEGLGLGSILESSYGAGARDSIVPSRRPSVSQGHAGAMGRQLEDDHGEDFVPSGFDEGSLRALCEMDCGMPLLLDRMKQSIASSSEAATFFKKRAAIEEEYARAMVKLARSSSQAYGASEGKAGTYVNSWIALLRTHELVGDNRLKFAAQLSEMSEELVTLGKEVDKSRKSSKELGTRLERGLAEQESLVDKARNRFDSAAEELERLLILKQGESLKDNMVPHASSASSTTSSNKRTFGKAMSKLKGPKNAAQVAKQEEDVRMRMGQSSDAYRSQVIGARAVRQEYFNLQLPRILRTLKESADEVDLGLQYHLSRYAYIFESTLLTDGLTIAPINPEDGAGLKTLVYSIDSRDDFKQYMQQYAVSWQMSGQRGPRREGPDEDGIMTSSKPVLTPRSSALAMSQQFAPPTTPTFGVDLGEQLARDATEVPRVLEKCCEAIELHGLTSMGIYRLSGTTSRVQRLKSALDRDIEGTDLLSDENLTDINDIAAVMKLWFRELPEPLLTWELYQGFIDAAKIENDRLRHIRLHERVNELPDPNYATLKLLMGHLDKVQQHEAMNQMGCSNIAIVFGPNLLGAPPNAGAGSALADMSWQCKCVETILQHYVEIFVDTDA